MPSEGDVTDSVPTFLKDLAAQIFICGKSINLLKLCSGSTVFDNLVFLSFMKVKLLHDYFEQVLLQVH
jgi:hypothetical protein